MNATEVRHTEDLTHQLAEARAVIAALLAGQIDAVVDPKDGAPVLLRNALEALQESEARYRYIVETTNEGVWLIDASQKTTFMNRRMAQMLGCESDMGVGRSPFEFLDEAGRAGFALHLERPSAHQVEVRYVRADGTSVWALVEGTPVFDSTGRYNGSLALVKDVTERKLAAEALAQLSQRTERRERILTTTLSAISDFAYTYDRDGRFLFVNQPLLNLWGITLEDAVGKNFFDLGYPADLATQLQREVQQVFETKTSLTGETPYTSPAGSNGYYEYIFSPAFAPDGSVEFVAGSTRDITDRKRVEAELRTAKEGAEAANEALQASLGEFRSLAEAMPQIVWIARPDGGNVYLNHQWMDYTGLTLEESSGDGWNKPFHPDDQQLAWDAWRRASTTIGTYSIESRVRRADGEYRWWLVRGVPLQDANGAIIKWFGTCTDIHDLKLADLEISRINRALGMLSRCNGALIRTTGERDLLNEICKIVVEAGGYRMAWIGYAENDESHSITPMAHAGVEERYLSEITVTWNANESQGQGPGGEAIRTGRAVVCDDVARAPRFARWLALAQQRGYRGNICLPLRNGTHTFGVLALYAAEVHRTSAQELALLQEMADNLAFGIGKVRAESERARLEVQVGEQAALLDIAHEAIVVKDLDGRIVYWNKGAERTYGWSAADAVGRMTAELFHHDAGFHEARTTLLALGEWRGEEIRRTKTGHPITVDVRWSLVRDDQGRPKSILAIAADITERRTLERQYLQAQKMEAIGQLASGVAHDFNNLLTVIQGFAGFVAEDATIDQRHSKDLAEIIKASTRAAALTKQLLAFSRQQVLQTAPLDVNLLLTDMTGMLGRLIGEHIQVSLALAPGLSLALADRGQLEQVVMNLVVNARDAMPGGGVVTIETADVELENSTFHQETIVHGRYVMLAVTDTGSGMTEEIKQHLFEPFFTTKETGKGTGLGLSTTYGIVKQSKGYIWVYSELGLGTTFKVYLPRANRDAIVATVRSELTAPIKRASQTLLLVEDEVGVRLLSKRILDKAGYRVLEAENGDDAEKVFAQHADSIDLLVTDVVMPGCGGPELLTRLHHQAPALKVLYMSGYTEQSAAQKAGIDRGASFVQKPFTAAELVRQVREALDR